MVIFVAFVLLYSLPTTLIIPVFITEGPDKPFKHDKENVCSVEKDMTKYVERELSAKNIGVKLCFKSFLDYDDEEKNGEPLDFPQYDELVEENNLSPLTPEEQAELEALKKDLAQPQGLTEEEKAELAALEADLGASSNTLSDDIFAELEMEFEGDDTSISDEEFLQLQKEFEGEDAKPKYEFTREEVLAAIERKKNAQSSPQFSREEVLAEIERRKNMPKIPYRIEKNGKIFKSVSSTTVVKNYVEQRTKSFSLPENFYTTYSWLWFEEKTVSVSKGILAGILAVSLIWLISFAIGWIVKGFISKT